MTVANPTSEQSAPQYTPQDDTPYTPEDIAGGWDAAARVCVEAGATTAQARDAAVGNPVLGGLAEAMEVLGTPLARWRLEAEA